MEHTIHDLRSRETELTEQIAEERDKSHPDEERLDDLIDERIEVRDQIAEHEIAHSQAERDVAVEQQW